MRSAFDANCTCSLEETVYPYVGICFSIRPWCGTWGRAASRSARCREVQARYWRIIATFGKYYGRWACVGEPIPLTDCHKALLQALRADKKEHPYVKDDFSTNPFLAIAKGCDCQDMNYSLMREEEFVYKKKKRKADDMWD